MNWELTSRRVCSAYLTSSLFLSLTLFTPPLSLCFPSLLLLSSISHLLTLLLFFKSHLLSMYPSLLPWSLTTDVLSHKQTNKQTRLNVSPICLLTKQMLTDHSLTRQHKKGFLHFCLKNDFNLFLCSSSDNPKQKRFFNKWFHASKDNRSSPCPLFFEVQLWIELITFFFLDKGVQISQIGWCRDVFELKTCYLLDLLMPHDWELLLKGSGF